MIRWFLTALAFLLLLRLVLRFVLGLFQGLAAPSGPQAASARTGGGPRGQVKSVALVRDPVCGTYIPRDGAVTALVGGETRSYCSTACRDKDAEARRFTPPPMGRAAHG